MYADKETYIKVLRNHLKEKYGPEYQLYSAYWDENDSLPEFKDYNAKRIIWLGGNIFDDWDFDVSKLNNYGLILTTHKSIADYIKSENKDLNVNALPLFIPEYDTSEVADEDKFTAIIGYPLFPYELLDKKGAKYRYYKPTDIRKLWKDLPYFNAVIGYPTSFSQLGLSLHPIILCAAARGVPIIGYYMKMGDDALSVLSDYAKYYRSEEELAEIWDNIGKKDENLKNYVLKYFSKQSVLSRFDELITNNLTVTEQVSVDISTAAGDYNSGDYWLARDFADALQKRGYKAYVTFGDTFFKPVSEINIIMRGTLNDVKFNLNGKINILYLAWSNLKVDGVEQIEPLEQYADEIAEIARQVDYLVVSSKKVAEALRQKGIQAEYIPEFTNINKFYPDFQTDKQSEMLFVGNFHFLRKGPLAAIQRGLPITIYGLHWPNEVEVKDFYIDNRILRQYYSSAKIVLNDTKQSMRDFGFMTTRLYDATASGAFVISDYIPEIAETYGDSVPMWRDADELEQLTKYYLEHEDERKAKAEKARKITLENFTSEKIAAQFDAFLQKIIREHSN